MVKVSVKFTNIKQKVCRNKTCSIYNDLRGHCLAPKMVVKSKGNPPKIALIQVKDL